MARALGILILILAIAFVPDMATGQKGQQFDFLTVSQPQRRQPSQRSQRRQSEREAFAVQRRACLQDDLDACEQALAYPGITSKDRDILQSKRLGILAARQAAERERSEVEAAERLRLEQERLAAIQAEVLAQRVAQVPQVSPVWSAAALLGAILVIGTAILLILVPDARAAAGSRLKARLRSPPMPSRRAVAAIFARRRQPRGPASSKSVPAAGAVAQPSMAEVRTAPVAQTPPRDTAGALAALELAQAYIEEVRDADVPGYADATMRKLHLNTLSLASKQLDTCQKLDPGAALEGKDAQGNSRRIGVNDLRAEVFLLEGLTHQGHDIRRAITALTAATHLSPNNPHAFFALGLTQAATGNKSAAVAALHRAVAINPRNVTYRKELNRAESLTSVEVAGYKSTRVGDKIVNAEISPWNGSNVVRNIAALPRRVVRFLSLH